MIHLEAMLLRKKPPEHVGSGVTKVQAIKLQDGEGIAALDQFLVELCGLAKGLELGEEAALCVYVYVWWVAMMVSAVLAHT